MKVGLLFAHHFNVCCVVVDTVICSKLQAELIKMLLMLALINYSFSGFKETSFMYAVSSAGLVHAFSRACSQGKLDRCTCDESFNDHKNRQAWLWGGCGDNIRFGHKFTRRFLKMVTSKSAKDLRATMNIHNTRLGMKVSLCGQI